MIILTPTPSSASDAASSVLAAAVDAIPNAPLGFGALWAGDLAAWEKIWGGGKGARNHFTLWLTQCGVRATLLFRISSALHRARVPFFPGWVARLNLTLHGLDIPPSVPIGPGLYLPHPVGTVVMAKSVGADVSLISAITIGMRNDPVFPHLGDKVFVGAGARVLGDIRIGNGASVGANAVVVKDVPPGRTAVGVPARLLPLAAQEGHGEA